MRLVFAASLFAFSFSAQAFTLVTTNPNQLGWQNHKVTFKINATNCPGGMDIEALVNEAAEVWNGVPTSDLEASADGTTASTTYANPTTVLCAANFNAVTGADEDFVPASASPDDTGNYISSGVIVLNHSGQDADIALFDRDRLKIILAHEMGHILGLGHSQEETALMYYSIGVKEKLILGQDDVDGITYLYPRDELSGDGMMGCGRVTGINLPPPGAKYLVLLLLLAPLLLAISSRSRMRLS